MRTTVGTMETLSGRARMRCVVSGYERGLTISIFDLFAPAPTPSRTRFERATWTLVLLDY
jgi:hypothetical protein